MTKPDLLPPWLRISMQAGGAALIALAGPGFYLATRDGAGASLILAAGVASLLLSRIDMIEQFAAWGISAKLREAKAAAEQATMSAEQIRRLALPLIRMALGIAMGSGRWGGPHLLRVAADEQAQKMLDVLGATPVERSEAYRDWTSFVLFDRARHAFHAMHKAAEGVKQSRIDASREALVHFGAEGAKVAPASDFEALARECDIYSPDIAARVAQLAEAQRRAAAGEPLDGPPPKDPDE